MEATGQERKLLGAPRAYSQGVSAEGIRAVRDGLRSVGSYTRRGSDHREAWKQVLGHNYWDCCGAYFVVTNAAAQLESSL